MGEVCYYGWALWFQQPKPESLVFFFFFFFLLEDVEVELSAAFPATHQSTHHHSFCNVDNGPNSLINKQAPIKCYSGHGNSSKQGNTKAEVDTEE